MHLRRRHLPLATLVLLATLGASPAPDTPLAWQPPGAERTVAERLNKPILYVFTADWCAPCHQLKRKVFNDPVHAKHIAERFYPVEVQDLRRENGRNTPEVAEVIRRYGVSTLPTLLVATPDGTELDRLKGYAGVDPTVEFLDLQHRKALLTLGSV
ncbi:MAG: thioredoxin family protein [Thermoanaerobaculia bacterium]|nr:thioredoxin family protein [Thermoanaerobaculia bacterium]